jgi:PhnB protein
MKCDMYLSFDGNCEAAMNYYKTIFNGEFTVTMRYSEGPPEYSNPQIENKIMHQTLVFGNGCELKASDSFHQPLHKGNNFHVSISVDNEEQAVSIFNGLANKGTITMPFNEVFWGGKFGSCIDKFGVQWMVSLGS